MGPERVTFRDSFLAKRFQQETVHSGLLRTLGPRWVDCKLPAAQAPRLLILFAFFRPYPCFRNDGATGSSPVSGTTFLKTVSIDVSATKVKAR